MQYVCTHYHEILTFYIKYAIMDSRKEFGVFMNRIQERRISDRHYER